MQTASLQHNADEVDSRGKAAGSQTLQALLDHPNMPAYIRDIYTHIRAKRSGGQGWQWYSTNLMIQYKVHLWGCTSAAKHS